jgi:predicted lipid-binding transport protein (Tim44 family)
MYNTFQDDINRFIANKQFNRLENIAVRQVDIVDAVQDQGEEYITVKFLASLLDYVVDETGQTQSGSTSDPVKFLEYWTFTRKVGERNWLLAGITQEGDYR